MIFFNNKVWFTSQASHTLFISSYINLLICE